MGYRYRDFEDYTKKFDCWYVRYAFAYLSEVYTVKRLLPEDDFGLEIGVGTGRFASALGIPLGIDPSKQSLKIAHQRGIEVILAVGEKLPFKDKIFSYVLMVVVLSFLLNPLQSLKEVYRVLKDGGRVVIGIIDRESFLGRIYQERKEKGYPFYREANFFTPKEVVEMLTRLGFKDFEILQTVSKPIESMENIEHPVKGYGKGGFVVIGAKKVKSIDGKNIVDS